LMKGGGTGGLLRQGGVGEKQWGSGMGAGFHTAEVGEGPDAALGSGSWPKGAWGRRSRASGGCGAVHGLVPVRTGRADADRCAPLQCGRVLTGGPATVQAVGSNGFESDSNLNGFKLLRNAPNFNRSKNDPPLLRKIEIKYGFDGFEEMNNFHHRNFFKFREVLEFEFD
jgi:hypothetical protein